MKILLLNSLFKPYYYGGAEKITDLMAYGLKERGNKIFILTISSKEEKRFEEVFNEIKIIRIPIKNIYFYNTKNKPNVFKRLIWHTIDIYNPLMAKEVEKIMLEIKPDIAICHNITGFSVSIWSAFKKHNIPVIQVLHDLYLLCPNSNMFDGKKACDKRCFKCRLFRLLHPYFSKNIEAVVGVSKFVLNRHLEYGLFKDAKIKTYIHNTLKIEKLPQVNFELKDKKPIFGFIGSLTPAKGIEKLLEVFSNINDTEIKLLIAGKGKEEYENYLKLKYDKENIKFFGYVKSDDFIKMIDVLIVPSLWNDTFPTVILEAFVNGVPVIGSNMGGIPEIVNEKNGWLFDVSEFDYLERLISNIVRNNEEIVKKRNFIVNERYRYVGFGKWISNYMEIINDIIKRKNT